MLEKLECRKIIFFKKTLFLHMNIKTILDKEMQFIGYTSLVFSLKYLWMLFW